MNKSTTTALPTCPPFCETVDGSSDADWGALEVVEVSGTSVTLSVITVYKNGTATAEGALLDVDTGYSNFTTFGSGSSVIYFVLAGNLQSGDPVWNIPGSPTLNETTTRTVVGVERMVNLLNFTSSVSFGDFSTYFSIEYVFDQEYGIFIEMSFASSSAGPGLNSQIEFAFGMVANNIWDQSSLPGFTLHANPDTVNMEESSSGTSTVTITRDAYFSPTVTLTATSSPDTLSCSFSDTSLTASEDTSILSCTGSSGTYTVVVTADGGYTSKQASVSFNIAAVAIPDFTISNSGIAPFQSGSSGTATITLSAVNGFSSSISLTVSVTPSGLTCSLNKNSIAGSGTATLTCQGQPGTYTVTVTATSESKTHATQTTVTVNQVATPTQPSSGQIPILYLGAGIAAAVIVVVAVALLLMRRKPAGTPEATP